MSFSKVSTIIILVGSALVFLALCTLPAAFDKNAEASLIGIAAALLSSGSITIAAGVYLKARALQAAAPAPASDAVKMRRGGCELCGNEAPVVKCNVHQLQLCGTCLARHYDYRSCSYVPSSLSLTANKPRAMAKTRGR